MQQTSPQQNYIPTNQQHFDNPWTLALSNKNDSKVLLGLCDFVCLQVSVFYSVCMIVDVTVCTHVLQWPCDFVYWQVNVFYSGCVILEVRDYRRSITGSYDTQYVLLKPTSQVSPLDHETNFLMYIEFWTWVQIAFSPWKKHEHNKVYDICM